MVLNGGARQRPYHVESTGTGRITVVKQRRARLALGWVTAWEPRVLLAFLFAPQITLTLSVTHSVPLVHLCLRYFFGIRNQTEG